MKTCDRCLFRGMAVKIPTIMRRQITYEHDHVCLATKETQLTFEGAVDPSYVRCSRRNHDHKCRFYKEENDGKLNEHPAG